jgi:hypothetical protein
MRAVNVRLEKAENYIKGHDEHGIKRLNCEKERIDGCEKNRNGGKEECRVKKRRRRKICGKKAGRK